MEDTQGIGREPEGSERGERHLARGLEDLTHLFLSHTPPPAPATVAPHTAGQPAGSADSRPRPPDRVTAASAPALTDVNLAQLIALLQSNAGVLEEGLRAVDANIPWEAGATIDLVAVDNRNRLAVVDADVAGSDAVLLRGICHLDWFARNAGIVRRMYTGHAIDFAHEPRLFLVAPRFSTVLRRAVDRITCLRITCVAYHLVTLPNGIGIFFEPA